ncbi:ROK family transcriptional regulator [Sinirhodobacter sp. WL0062]|uniref:ROK family transcriptional regulator n=1 Tax=Rhodobacter flavimaris TaxID=2907145 RepID=A0ABS8YWY1_9RHOB|nr:ROK family transcriptional regulator [Sinirhodobacter sp. WL0062]MCE5974319.1 ROK family transcriptional regulator [Sinirhodobacter sp. WL0062]
MEMDKVRSLSGGVNQSGVRAYNERLLLTTLLRHGALPGSDIARRTGLSPQTISVILRKLEGDGLLVRGESVKGKVGKPFVPMAINPQGLFSYGMKIGRRSADLLVMDFQGNIRKQLHTRYNYPMPTEVFSFLHEGIQEIEAAMTSDEVSRICGLGIAAPFEMWSWHEQVRAPEAEFQVWREISFAEEVARFSQLPVFVVNDATAACRAEHMFGRGKEFRDYAYFFLAAFIGGGVVLNHSVYEGYQGNAGSLGSLPSRRDDGSECQLLDRASIHLLESSLIQNGIDPDRLWRVPQDWSSLSEWVAPWLEQTAAALAHASLTTCAVIDFEAILIDGALPPDVRERLVARVRERVSRLDTRGIIIPAIEAGMIGANARAIGAASSPVIAQFLLDTNAGLAEA